MTTTVTELDEHTDTCDCMDCEIERALDEDADTWADAWTD